MQVMQVMHVMHRGSMHRLTLRRSGVVRSWPRVDNGGEIALHSGPLGVSQVARISPAHAAERTTLRQAIAGPKLPLTSSHQRGVVCREAHLPGKGA
jgi:hypothetical protein